MPWMASRRSSTGPMMACMLRPSSPSSRAPREMALMSRAIAPPLAVSISPPAKYTLRPISDADPNASRSEAAYTLPPTLPVTVMDWAALTRVPEIAPLTRTVFPSAITSPSTVPSMTTASPYRMMSFWIVTPAGIESPYTIPWAWAVE